MHVFLNEVIVVCYFLILSIDEQNNARWATLFLSLCGQSGQSLCTEWRPTRGYLLPMFATLYLNWARVTLWGDSRTYRWRLNSFISLKSEIFLKQYVWHYNLLHGWLAVNSSSWLVVIWSARIAHKYFLVIWKTFLKGCSTFKFFTQKMSTNGKLGEMAQSWPVIF